MVRPITVSAGFSITVFALIVTVLGGLGRSPGPCCGDHPRDHQQHRRRTSGHSSSLIILLGAAAVTILIRPSGLLGVRE